MIITKWEILVLSQFGVEFVGSFKFIKKKLASLFLKFQWGV